jgi:hypothetical protein
MISAWSCRSKEALGQHIKLCPAEHLALEHFQPVDLSYSRILTPRPRHRCLHGGYVRWESFGEASEGREGALSGARQPRR